MFATNLFVGVIAAGVCLFSFVMIIIQARRLPPNPSLLEKLKRATIVGLGFLVFFISGVVAVDYLSTPGVEKEWSYKTFLGLLCFLAPMFLLTLVGSFIWFSRSDATRQFLSRRLKDINQKSNNEK